MTISTDQVVMTGDRLSDATPSAAGKQRYLFSPMIDFLCLGGSSLLLFPIVLMLPEKELTPFFIIAFMGAAHFINHPHFAFSYQVFYEDYRRKAFGSEYDGMLRARYIFAGIIVPVLLVAFLALSMINENSRLLGYGGNLMAFLVGWHYVKQGYGMLMVDAALKRQYFNAWQKKILEINAYALWAATWLGANFAMTQRKLWGIEYYMLDVPQSVLTISVNIGLFTSVLALYVLAVKWRDNGGSLPLNGVIAYLVTLYLWLLMVRINVLWMLMVPALHSIQYLVVVMRYRLNRFKDESDATDVPPKTLLNHVFHSCYQRRFAAFILLGILLGYMGFWGMPEFLQAFVPHDQVALGTTAFLFIFWICINVHHYFLDNVMWRSQNPDVRKHLFS